MSKKIRKPTYFREKQSSEQQSQLAEQRLRELSSQIVSRTLNITAYQLHDKFDFDSEKLKELFSHINETIDSIEKDYVSSDDIVEIVRNEIGINI